MKKALVLTGGGVKGAFQVGALLHLIGDLKEEYDIITGISVGALNGSFLAQYNKKDLKLGIKDLYDLWLTIENKKIKKNWCPLGYVHYLWEKSLYNSAPLEKMVDEVLDAEAIKASDIKLNVGAVAVGSGKYLEYSDQDPNIKNAVKASAAFPVFFRPVKFNNDWHVDGGVKEVAPLSKAIRMGAEHITIINTGPLESTAIKAKDLSFIEYPLRMIELQGDEVVRNDLREFIETNEMIGSGQLTNTNKKYIEYKYIEPDAVLTHNALEFDPKEIRKMIEKGRKSAAEKG